MPANMNTGHALYGNLKRSLKPAGIAPYMEDQNGTADTDEQAIWEMKSSLLQSAMTPIQGFAVDDDYIYTIDTTAIQKYDRATGTLQTSNSSALSGLPATIDHLGDGFVEGSYLYIGASKAGGDQLATACAIAVYNISDLTLNTYEDTFATAGAAFNAGGICLSPDGTEIYGCTWYTDTTPAVYQRTLYRFNLATLAYIGTHTLSTEVVGAQGLTWTGTEYRICSYDVSGSLDNHIKRFDASFTYLGKAHVGHISATAGEIQGCDWHDGVFYACSTNSRISQIESEALWLRGATYSSDFKFLEGVDIPDSGSLVMQIEPSYNFNYGLVWGNAVSSDYWKSWIYGDDRIAFRFGSTATVYTLAQAEGTPITLMYSWDKSGSSVDISIGINGITVSTNSGTWITAPSTGLYLGGTHNDVPNLVYRDLVVYDKVLSDAEFLDLHNDYDSIYAGTGGSAYSISGSSEIAISPAASTLQFIRHEQISGDVTVSVVPSASALMYSQNHQVAGDLTIAVQPEASLQYSASYSLAGDASLVIGSSAATEYSRHFSFVGDTAVQFTPEASLQYSQHSALVGDVSVSFTAAATMGYSAGFSIIGDVGMSVLSASAMLYSRHYVLAGDSSIAITPDAVFFHAQANAIVGDVSVLLTPLAAMAYAQTGSITGDVTFGLTPASAMSYSQGASIVGDVSIAVSAEAALAYSIHSSLIGDTRVGLLASAAFEYQAQLNYAIAGDSLFSMTPIATMRHSQEENQIPTEIFTVEKQDREFTLPASSREFIVPAQNRTFTVH